MGKTTLLKSILGLIPSLAGEVLFNGVLVAYQGKRSFNRHFIERRLLLEKCFRLLKSTGNIARLTEIFPSSFKFSSGFWIGETVF